MDLKKWGIFFISAFLLFIMTAEVYAKKKTSGGDVILDINGQKVTRSEFGEFLIKAYGDVALDFLVKRKVVEQEAKKHGVKITKKELEERLERNADVQVNLMMRQKGLTSKEDLELVLFKQGITLDKLRKKIIDSLKNQAGVEMMVEKILIKDITYTEDELKEAYDDRFGEKVHAKQIVLKTRKKAEDVLMKLRGGADFSKLAQKESIDRASAAREGEMMPFGVNTTLGRSVKGLKKGQLSDIIQTGYGYHIIELIDRIPGSEKKFEEVQEQLEAIVKAEKLRQEIQPWLRSLFEAAEVEILM